MPANLIASGQDQSDQCRENAEYETRDAVCGESSVVLIQQQLYVFEGEG